MVKVDGVAKAEKVANAAKAAAGGADQAMIPALLRRSMIRALL